LAGSFVKWRSAFFLLHLGSVKAAEARVTRGKGIPIELRDQENQTVKDISDASYTGTIGIEIVRP
jgi:hypothetical protein